MALALDHQPINEKSRDIIVRLSFIHLDNINKYNFKNKFIEFLKQQGVLV